MIAEPKTPTGEPYASFAVLRQQRLSDDVLPATYTSTESDIIPASARRVLTEKEGDVWVAASASVWIGDVSD